VRRSFLAVAAGLFLFQLLFFPPGNLVSAHELVSRNNLLGQISRDSDIVAFNTSNSKFHALTCMWAERCTVHCINITRKEAHKRGGIPCKVCGGGE
jgi:hypothetical protein